MTPDTRAYDSALTAEAFGLFTNPIRRGAAPGGGMAIIAALVKKFPPFPLGAPLPDMLSGKYLESPCPNPRERVAVYHTPVCQCGFALGEHKTKGGAA